MSGVNRQNNWTTRSPQYRVTDLVNPLLAISLCAFDKHKLLKIQYFAWLYYLSNISVN